MSECQVLVLPRTRFIQEQVIKLVDMKRTRLNVCISACSGKSHINILQANTNWGRCIGTSHCHVTICIAQTAVQNAQVGQRGVLLLYVLHV